MADIYVKSSAATPTSPYNSWSTGAALLATAAGVDAAGDTIWVSQAHSESSATAQTIALAGTIANPVKILCGDDANSPPISLATSAVIATTGASSLTVTGSGYLYGLTLQAGSGSNNASLNFCASASTPTPEHQVLENCSLIHGSTAGSVQSISFGLTSATGDRSLELLNTNIKFSGAGNRIVVASTTTITGGAIASGSSTPSAGIFTGGTNSAGSGGKLTCKGFDFSNLSSTVSLVASSSFESTFTFINCKLPAAWTGSLLASGSTTFGKSSRAAMYNCDSGATNYRLWIEDYSGSIKSESTIVKTNGASDGTTALSLKMATNANANEYTSILRSDDMAVWIDSTGTSKTITVDIIHDSATPLTDAEVWLEVDYLGSSASPLGSELSDKRATVVTTPTNQTTSTATWTTTGLTNPNKQQLEVTFTPQMKGFVYARVCLCKPSYTIYVDYEPTVV